MTLLYKIRKVLLRIVVITKFVLKTVRSQHIEQCTHIEGATQLLKMYS